MGATRRVRVATPVVGGTGGVLFAWLCDLPAWLAVALLIAPGMLLIVEVLASAAERISGARVNLAALRLEHLILVRNIRLLEESQGAASDGEV